MEFDQPAYIEASAPNPQYGKSGVILDCTFECLNHADANDFVSYLQRLPATNVPAEPNPDAPNDARKVLDALDLIAKAVVENQSGPLRTSIRNILERWINTLPDSLERPQRDQLQELEKALATMLALIVARGTEILELPEEPENPILYKGSDQLF